MHKSNVIKLYVKLVGVLVTCTEVNKVPEPVNLVCRKFLTFRVSCRIYSAKSALYIMSIRKVWSALIKIRQDEMSQLPNGGKIPAPTTAHFHFCLLKIVFPQWNPNITLLCPFSNSGKKKKSKISASADGGPRSCVRAHGALRSAPHLH